MVHHNKNICDRFSKFMNPFEAEIIILKYQMLRDLPLELTMPGFWGSFFAFWGILGVLMLFFCIFDPQRALPYQKIHLWEYFMKLSDKRCRPHPSSGTPKGEKYHRG